MNDVAPDLVEWLARDEEGSRHYRAERLKELLSIFESQKTHVLFWGGTVSHQSYMELRLAFIHGLYLSTVLLTLACIEQELAGTLHGEGDNEAAKMNLETLLQTARSRGYVNQNLFSEINALRSIRNSYAHYRPPGDKRHYMQRALKRTDVSNDLSKDDALRALHTLAQLLSTSWT